MAITLSQTYQASVGSTVLVHVNFTKYLRTGESLTGTVLVDEQGGSDLTIANKVVTTASYEESFTNDTVAAGKAIQFTVTGGVGEKTYRMRCTVSTNGSPALTFVFDLLLKYV